MSYDDDFLPFDPFDSGDDDEDDFEMESEFGLSSELEEAERQIRIQRMREEIESKGGIWNPVASASDLSSEAEEALLRRVLFFKNARRTTHAKLLIGKGIELPLPDSLETEQELRDRLWDIIHGLASVRVFLTSTNHLSDRALYAQLWYQHLNVETVDISADQEADCQIDLLGGGTEEETLTWLKFYADEDEREWWRGPLEAEGHTIPESEKPLYQRDSLLPKREEY